MGRLRNYSCTAVSLRLCRIARLASQATIGKSFPHPAKPMPDTSETSQPVSATDPRSDAEWRVDRALPRALARLLALDDFEEPARPYLPRPMFGYVSGGAETNAALPADRAPLDQSEVSPP